MGGPLQGLGDGMRHKDNIIECGACGMQFKSTRLFAKHCSTSKEHQQATARVEQKMLADAEEKRMEEMSNKMRSTEKVQKNDNESGESRPLTLSKTASQQIHESTFHSPPNINV